ncbi:rhodanese-like domain-containing protein [Lactobacillus selangorensis]|nr:rhodanese-like domain-containing protein [Lactobacillus selangorensis]
MFGSWLYYRVQRKHLGGELSEEDFEKTMRKAQIIDLREKKDFNANHILGARNMPYTTFRNTYAELRPDLPVYLYESGTTLAVRATRMLRKKGFTNVKWLAGGYEDWTGKTKTGK